MNLAQPGKIGRRSDGVLTLPTLKLTIPSLAVQQTQQPVDTFTILEVIMSTLQITYDGSQHCTALRKSHGNTVAMDCPHTGKGEEFSPGQMVGSALAGCMFLSMGVVAQRDNIDFLGVTADVDVAMVEKPVSRIGSIELTFNMPRGLSDRDRTKLERAAGFCPIKHSFHPDVSTSIRFDYPDKA